MKGCVYPNLIDCKMCLHLMPQVEQDTLSKVMVIHQHMHVYRLNRAMGAI